MILNKTQILERIKNEDMISEYIDLDTQITSNGFDLTVKDISLYMSVGTIDFDNTRREIPKCVLLRDCVGEYHIQFGAYLVDFNEYLKIPSDLIAIGRTRSSLLRMGSYIPSSVWDSGFVGYSQGMLVVNNGYGINVIKNARVLQLIFMTREDDKSVYDGGWGEKVMQPPLLEDPPEPDMKSLDAIILHIEEAKEI